jgi:hypothetical protein
LRGWQKSHPHKTAKEGSKMRELCRINDQVAYYACAEEGCRRIASWELIGEWKEINEVVIVRVCDIHLRDWEECLDCPNKFYILTEAHIRSFPFTKLREMGYELQL